VRPATTSPVTDLIRRRASLSFCNSSGDLDKFGGLFEGESTQKAQFHNSVLAHVWGGEPLHGAIQATARLWLHGEIDKGAAA
jgi:hypothetical protein